MSGNNFIVPPKSKRDIINTANLIRNKLKITSYNFDLSRLLSILYEDLEFFQLEICAEKEMRGAEAYCSMRGDKIILSEVTYSNLCAKNLSGHKRARFTVAHELGHYFLHANQVEKMMARSNNTPVFSQSEWQANTFASYFLMPEELIPKGKDINTLSRIFQISQSAIIYRLKKSS